MAVVLGIKRNSTAVGWTSISGFDHTYYVSDSDGNDGFDGLTTSTPKKTLSAGLTLLGANNGSFQRLLLKRGDTFTDQEIGNINVHGTSTSAPCVWDAYGSGARPIIAFNPAVTGADACIRTDFSSGSGNGDYLAFRNIDFYGYKRDPGNGAFDNTDPVALAFDFQRPFNWILFEGCMFRFFRQSNFQPQIAFGGRGASPIVRRNVFRNHYGHHALPADGFHSTPVYFDRCDGIVLDENIFDSNGAEPAVTDSVGTYFNHHCYINRTCGPVASVCDNLGIRGRASSDLLIRAGGFVDGNLQVSTGYGFSLWGYGDDYITEVGGTPGTLTATNNMSLENYSFVFNGTDNGGTALGIDNGQATATGNVAAHAVSTNGGDAILLDTASAGCTVTGNFVYDFNSNVIHDTGTGNTTSPNTIGGTGYTDPNRSVATYMVSLGLGTSLDDFAALAIAQSEGNWDSRFTALAVQNYVREGFDLAPLGDGLDHSNNITTRYVYEARTA